jgi:hypothetical protein
MSTDLREFTENEINTAFVCGVLAHYSMDYYD